MNENVEKACPLTLPPTCLPTYLPTYLPASSLSYTVLARVLLSFL